MLTTKYRIKRRKETDYLQYYYEGRFLLLFAWNRWVNVPTINYYDLTKYDSWESQYVRGVNECKRIAKEFPDISKYIEELQERAERRRIARKLEKRRITYL